MATPEFQDYYKTLGVSRTATQAEIKKAFRKLARDSHPDKHPGDKSAEARFKAINEANAVLSDPAKRSKYDQFGRDWEAYSRAGAAAGGADPFGGQNPFAGWAGGGGSTRRSGSSGGVRYEFRTTGGGAGAAGFSDFFRMMFGDENAAAGEPERFGGQGGAGARMGGGMGGNESMEELLSRLGMAGATGAGGATRNGSGARSAAMPPVEVTADISLEESFHGTSRIVEIDGKRLEVTIPRGAGDGSRIKLTGKAPGGRDLVVVTKLKPHKVFTRRGDDLERELPVTLGEALLGGEIPVSTLKGRVLLKVPAGTQAGRVIRLKGQGMPRFKGDGTGDLLVRIRVVLPTDLSDEARAAAASLVQLIDQPDPRG
ncbi:MAG TPA: J domain-containing protein [Candidatus Limnocylindrales bacterium]|nr:J domain-containing protein [Candidatus Limnocylindrales bacterium]